MSSPFKTPEFKALFEQWNRTLERNGHQEIEDFGHPDTPLRSWHNLKWKRLSQDQQQDTAQYYEWAINVLWIFKFECRLHKRIWALHCEGLSLRKIAQKIKTRKKSVIYDIILRIERSARSSYL